MEKVLLLGNPHTLNPLCEDLGEVDCCGAFANNSLFNRALRRCPMFIGEAFGGWKKRLADYSCVVICEQSYRKGIIGYLKRNNPKLRVIVYFRNTVAYLNSCKYKISLREIESQGAELWSYNYQDCKLYGFRYNNQFFNPELVKTSKEFAPEEYDVTFLGKEKGRAGQLKEILECCESKGLKCRFTLVGENETNEELYVEFMKDMIKYSDYLSDYVTNTKAIVDVVNQGNYGLTIRPLEAMFFGKKLITTYADIAEEEFYKRENIFIWGKDDVDGLDQFISEPYIEISDAIKNKYTSRAWIDRFFS